MKAAFKKHGTWRMTVAAVLGLAAGLVQAATYQGEAESGTVSGTGVAAKYDDPNASGGGYVGNFTANGDTLTVSIPGVSAGTYDVYVRFRAWGEQHNTVQINGAAARDEDFLTSGNTWTDHILPSVPLVSGTNVFVIGKEWGYMDVDYIRLVPSGSPPLAQTLAEAESGVPSGAGVSVQSDASASGGRYVGNFTSNGDTLAVSLANVVAGTYDVTIRYRAWGLQQNNVQINGGPVRSEQFPAQNNTWMDHVIPAVALANGTNTVVISKDWGYMDVDYVRISPSGSSNTSAGWGNDPGIPLRSPNDPMPDWLQVGNASYAYWVNDGIWGAQGLTRGTYTDNSGTQYETAYGRSSTVGPNGEVAWRSAWKWPTGTTEVKAYPSAIFGAKPGFYNPSNTPGGYHILLPDGTYSATAPSGATPGTFLPLPANGALPAINSSFAYRNLVTPSGRGHLTFDIWLQSTPQQINGFGAPPISHEIMIPLDYWGNYGAYPYRNPAWYSHDVTLEGRLWHVYMARHFGGTWDPQTQTSTGGWTWVVFEPDVPLNENTLYTLNLSTFINYLPTRSDATGPWANGSEYLSSIELGVEPVDGVGDLEVSNYRVWKP